MSSSFRLDIGTVITLPIPSPLDCSEFTTPPVALDLMHQLTEAAIAFTLANRVAHLDLKPRNKPSRLSSYGRSPAPCHDRLWRLRLCRLARYPNRRGSSELHMARLRVIARFVPIFGRADTGVVVYGFSVRRSRSASRVAGQEPIIG